MDKTLILNKLCELKNFSSKSQFAKFLGVSPAHVANWYARNTYDLETLIKKFPDVNPHWLVTGEGEMLYKSIINGTNGIQTVGNENKMNEIINQNEDFVAITKKALENQDKTLSILNNLVNNLINANYEK